MYFQTRCERFPYFLGTNPGARILVNLACGETPLIRAQALNYLISLQRLHPDRTNTYPTQQSRDALHARIEMESRPIQRLIYKVLVCGKDARVIDTLLSEPPDLPEPLYSYDPQDHRGLRRNRAFKGFFAEMRHRAELRAKRMSPPGDVAPQHGFNRYSITTEIL